jgi:hypothetical protein
VLHIFHVPPNGAQRSADKTVAEISSSSGLEEKEKVKLEARGWR